MPYQPLQYLKDEQHTPACAMLRGEQMLNSTISIKMFINRCKNDKLRITMELVWWPPKLIITNSLVYGLNLNHRVPEFRKHKLALSTNIKGTVLQIVIVKDYGYDIYIRRIVILCWVEVNFLTTKCHFHIQDINICFVPLYWWLTF